MFFFCIHFIIIVQCLFKDGKATVMDDQAYENIHVVASILKMYLRLLPIPLITFDVHPLIIRALGKYRLGNLIDTHYVTLILFLCKL